MPRVLVVVPNDSYRAADFVDAAAALGVDLAIASEDRPPLRPDGRFVEVDCDDVESSAVLLADLAAATPIDAIIAADDAGVALAARASELIGLPANAPSAAASTLDKGVMRRRLDEAEVPQPDFVLVGAGVDVTDAVARLGPPVVIKPTNLSASRGVLRVDSVGEASHTASRIRSIAGENVTLLVESYLDGPECSVEGIVWDGEVEVLAVLDKPIPMPGPAFEETIFVTPSRHRPEVLAEIHRLTAQATAALGLTQGPIHAEFRIVDGRPVVLEIAARTIGGLCGRSLRFGLLGAPLETMVLRQALGMRKASLRREPAASGVLMVPIPAAGRLLAVAGVDEVRDLPAVTSVELTAPIGSFVAPPPDGDRYLGFVFARAPEPDEVESALREAIRLIRVDVDPTSSRHQ